MVVCKTMETITRSGRAVHGFALGDVGRGGGGGSFHGGGFHGGFRGGLHPGFRRGLPGGWGWWGVPYVPAVETLPVGPCAAWGDPVIMPSGMAMAARAALGASGGEPTAARGPDGVLYRFSVENSEIVVRPCASQAGTLGDGPGVGLAQAGGGSMLYAELMTGAAVGLLAHILRAPLWGAVVAGAGAALMTRIGIDRA